MKIIRYRDIRNIPQAIFDYLVNNVTMGSRGLMQRNAENFREQSKGTFPVSVALDDQEVPIGWMLYDNSDRAEMYVIPKFRRQGVATKLLLELASILGKSPSAIDVYNFAAERVQRAAERQYQTGG